MSPSFFTAPLAIIVSTLFVLASVSPAAAASDAECVGPAQSIQAAATAHIDSSVAKKALKYSRTGELLCEAGNERAASKKFELAFKTLGINAPEYAEVAK